MQLGIIGLGRMGGNIARRLMKHGHEVAVYDRSAETVAGLGKEGAVTADSLDGVIAALAQPRAIWVMLPAGEPTEQTIAELADRLAPGDVIIDGGNTYYKDDIRRAKTLAEKGIDYVDVGTSGGVWGLERGYCMMIGGKSEAVERLEPIFEALAPGYGSIERTRGRNAPDERAERGFIFTGPAGSGHFVKMVHNGIEYGLMQAYAEGFDILKMKNSDKLPEDERFDLDLADIAEVWRRGSVVSSWLLDLTAQALAGDVALEKFSGSVADSGEGRWTIEAAIEEAVPVNVLSAALYARFRSRQQATYADKLLSAMRFGFGGHVEIPQ
ncbi:decarboxylating 6-phosphogluconate dehydrogenase [Pseudomonas sp. HR1]|jgi:6-phosphogluconate dehydrogenase|uniref:6-phosphogluconate dehydrogenase n=2 Tax=Pseudomonadaceae TaxID=135621 RepID=A0A1G5NZG4_9PSED|nr:MULTISPECIES: decarboxylating 6-phosphogluconate dehydrogenase [Pseudomonas]EHK71068.1 6-phosphogluconate dehydrogenase-like protein [Pseudomonas psychrotolerans L19]KIZ52907.1 6-phosphogluconate dehydrogenase [Pseudomonas oryzihabitans]KTT54127.1 6-phosphogluconate dehydrogenase [Pseudomonas psychrotolerans]MBA1181030.1 decarboxylating 6-phosphogluconate dehydrogenase [Pseudomonas psychrotolerans]MBA1212015.1 decarboxylating 6-phosphogluconate dehydrogenase [Pseudomonas psychrotolerans]